MSSKQQANKLAKALSDFTIESLEKDEQNFGWSNWSKTLVGCFGFGWSNSKVGRKRRSEKFEPKSEKLEENDPKLAEKTSLLDLPNEVLVNIFSFVGDPKFNKYPEENYPEWLSSRNSTQKSEWIQKKNRKFAMKNLMSLRRVCTVFEDIINNGMMPGLDYEPIEVDLKFLSFSVQPADSLNAVEMWKFGGIDDVSPRTHLEKISMNLQKFEKIRNLSFHRISLTRDLFQMILRMDLKSAKRVEFVDIPDVQLGEDVNVVEYIQNIRDTVDSQAKFFFKSAVFDPHLVLFGQEAAASAHLPEARYDGLDHLKGLVCFPTRPTRRYRTINIIHNILLSEPHIPHKDYEYRLKDGYNHWKKELMKTFKKKIEKQSRKVKENGEWHLQKIFVLMENQPIKKTELMFHLKVLKKITKGAKLSKDEKSMITSGGY